MACTEPGATYTGPWPQEHPSPSAPTVGHTPFPTAPTRLRRSSMTSTALPSRTKPTTSFPSRLRFHENAPGHAHRACSGGGFGRPFGELFALLLVRRAAFGLLRAVHQRD